MKISILPLNKVIIDAFDIDKMLYGILIFIVEIHSVSLYNPVFDSYITQQ